MRNPVRKFVGVALVGVLGALFAMPMLTAGAAPNGSTGSNGVPPPPPGACNVTSVTPASPVPAGTQLTISGTAPSTDNTRVVLYANGVPATPVGATDVVAQTVTDGTFTLKYTVNATVTLTVNYTYGNQNAYNAVCTFPGGVLSMVITVLGANVAAPAALAFTGSSDTPSYVLIGIAAVVFGAVLVVAARRRSQVS